MARWNHYTQVRGTYSSDDIDDAPHIQEYGSFIRIAHSMNTISTALSQQIHFYQFTS